MKTYPLKSDEGEYVGFEIPNNFLNSGSIANYFKRLSGCEIKWVRKIFSSSEIHVKFIYGNTDFEVWEPFGDNSRLHIGPISEADGEVVEKLEKEVAAS